MSTVDMPTLDTTMPTLPELSTLPSVPLMPNPKPMPMPTTDIPVLDTPVLDILDLDTPVLDMLVLDTPVLDTDTPMATELTPTLLTAVPMVPMDTVGSFLTLINTFSAVTSFSVPSN